MANLTLTSVAGAAALIDAICTFIGANGWTVERNTLSGGARTATVRYGTQTDYIHLYAATSGASEEVRMRVSIDYSAAAAYNAQTRQSPADSRSNMTGPFPNVYMYVDGAAVHVAIQIAGVVEFRHLCFGLLEKAGAYTGGTYADGSWRSTSYQGDFNTSNHHVPFSSGNNSGPGQSPYPGFVRYDILADSIVDGYANIGLGSSYVGAVWAGWSSWDAQETLGKITGGADANNFDGRSVFHPFTLFVRRAGGYWSPLGQVRNTQACNMTKFSPAQEIVIGGDTYVVFPAFKRSMTVNPSNTAPDLGSHTMGYAVKKVP
ncbi:MAG TPA: hypothetical protein VIO38_14785 [Rariglobus sp.]